jgi:endonuclease-3
LPEEKRRKREVVARILAHYPDAHCELEHEDAFQLLVATVLSAQSTDARVNVVTRRLFQTVHGPEDLVRLGEEGVAREIRDLGLYRAKARHLVAMAELLLSRHGGQVPSKREELEALPGVGRKTANVVLSNAFGVPALAVDTHVFRVSHRLGLSAAPTPRGTEEDLCRLIPRRDWTHAHHALIFHGRRICHARAPECGRCPVQDLCPSALGVEAEASARP